MMTTIHIDILNPKVEKLLRALEDLKLIAIRHSSNDGFKDALAKFRSKSQSAPSFDEITKEVELVRAKRYAKNSTTNLRLS